VKPALSNDVDAFLDIVYGDVELLRSEFDDLIAASWEGTPTRPPGGYRPRPHRERSQRPSSRPAPRLLAMSHQPPGRRFGADGGRQRAPPRAERRRGT
jgi:hypothetical protein